jgi:hypothetical protein
LQKLQNWQRLIHLLLPRLTAAIFEARASRAFLVLHLSNLLRLLQGMEAA